VAARDRKQNLSDYADYIPRERQAFPDPSKALYSTLVEFVEFSNRNFKIAVRFDSIRVEFELFDSSQFESEL
jgi:hypothetical protein